MMKSLKEKVIKTIFYAFVLAILNDLYG